MSLIIYRFVCNLKMIQRLPKQWFWKGGTIFFVTSFIPLILIVLYVLSERHHNDHIIYFHAPA